MAKRLDYGKAGLHKITKSENPTAFKAKQFIVKKTGEVISGAKARKLAGSQAPSRLTKSEKGRKVVSQAKPISSQKGNEQYKKFISAFVEKQNKQLERDGLKPTFTRGEARTNPQFKKAYADFKAETKKRKVDTKPHSRLARSLEDIGIREENANWGVGETPD